MKIGRLQIATFKNYYLGTNPRVPVTKFYIKIGRASVSINFAGRCIMIRIIRRNKYSVGKPISIESFAKLMKSKGVDLSKSTPVEMRLPNENNSLILPKNRQ